MRFTTAARSDRRKFASNAGTQPNVPSIIFVTRVSDSPCASAAIRPMREVVDRQLAPWRFAALLFSLLAALALVVAAVGLYALLAHQVTARTRGIGIRMALGARRGQIVRFFALRTVWVIAAGLLPGLIADGRQKHERAALRRRAGRCGDICDCLPAPASCRDRGSIQATLRRATAVDPIVALREQ